MSITKPAAVSNNSEKKQSFNLLRTSLLVAYDEQKDPNLSQNLFSPAPPLASISRYSGRLVKSQLTGNGDDDIGGLNDDNGIGASDE